jgi:Fe-S cluster assembly iron-binding protein IscA
MQITKEAQDQIAELMKANKKVMPEQPFFLRITAIFDADDKLKQQTYFDYETRTDDRLLRFKDFDLRIDEESYTHLKNATLEYYENDEKTGFFLDNPKSHDHSSQNVI